MAARVVEGLFTCLKRWELEERLLETGHKWPRNAVRNREPLSAAECVVRVLCWLDLRGDPHGRMYGVAPAEIERAAHWTGTPGALVSALVSTGWVDEDADGMRWHGYGSLNRITLSDRAKKRDKRGDGGARKRGTDRGTEQGTHPGTDRGRPSPSPGDPQKDLPGLRGGSGLGAPPATEVRTHDPILDRTPEEQRAHLAKVTADRAAHAAKIAAIRNGRKPS